MNVHVLSSFMKSIAHLPDYSWMEKIKLTKWIHKYGNKVSFIFLPRYSWMHWNEIKAMNIE